MASFQKKCLIKLYLFHIGLNDCVGRLFCVSVIVGMIYQAGILFINLRYILIYADVYRYFNKRIEIITFFNHIVSPIYNDGYLWMYINVALITFFYLAKYFLICPLTR